VGKIWFEVNHDVLESVQTAGFIVTGSLETRASQIAEEVAMKSAIDRKIPYSGLGIVLMVMVLIGTQSWAARGGNGGKNNGGEYTCSTCLEINDPSEIIGFQVDILGSPDGDDIRGGSRIDLIKGGDGGDGIRGLGGPDELHGEGGGDYIEGGEGNDVLYGQEGGDLLNGGPGHDELYGGAGDEDNLVATEGYDIYDGGDGTEDWIVFSNALLVNADLGTGEFDAFFVTGQEFGQFINIEAIWGSPGNDVIHGGENADILIGAEGDDQIFGHAGDDEIHAQEGDDFVYGGSGNDVITGWGGNDSLYGESGDDQLSGPGGSDQNDDILIGGAGCDAFQFNRAWGRDTIEDFKNDCPTEVIDLSGRNCGPRKFSGFEDLDTYVEGTDLVIEFTYRCGGQNEGGFIVIKDGKDLELSPSDFVF
jgi:Ca2+-binding RTX toxin-like protein